MKTAVTKMKNLCKLFSQDFMKNIFTCSIHGSIMAVKLSVLPITFFPYTVVLNILFSVFKAFRYAQLTMSRFIS